jgi:hypothetical protein
MREVMREASLRDVLTIIDDTNQRPQSVTPPPSPPVTAEHTSAYVGIRRHTDPTILEDDLKIFEVQATMRLSLLALLVQKYKC